MPDAPNRRSRRRRADRHPHQARRDRAGAEQLQAPARGLRERPQAPACATPRSSGSTRPSRWPATCSRRSTTSTGRSRPRRRPATRARWRRAWPRPRRSSSTCCSGTGSRESSVGPGTVFDPNLHQAVMQQPTDDFEPGQVVQVLATGLHDPRPRAAAGHGDRGSAPAG